MTEDDGWTAVTKKKKGRNELTAGQTFSSVEDKKRRAVAVEVPLELKVGSKFIVPPSSCMYNYTRQGCVRQIDGSCKRYHDIVGRKRMESEQIFLCLTLKCGSLFTPTADAPKNCISCCKQWLALYRPTTLSNDDNKSTKNI